jgi:hypothetical protein
VLIKEILLPVSMRLIYALFLNHSGKRGSPFTYKNSKEFFEQKLGLEIKSES